MSTLFPEKGSAKRKSMMKDQLVQGQESANQLRVLLQKPFVADGSLTAEELVAKILRSFTETLSVLTSSEAGGEVGQNLVISGENGSLVAASCNDRRSGDYIESRKRSSPATKDRRGCYKRRKTEQSWTIVSHTTDDDHAWRKYGQKEILKSKFPRSYFRCTRKHDQGCGAIKQVQRIQENPEKYQTTYIGLHTCKVILKAPEIVTDCGTWESFLAPDSKVPNEQLHPHPSSSSTTPTIKQEYPKQDTPSDVTDNLDPILWPLKDFELSEPAIMPSKMASENADVDFGVGSIDFVPHFPFD